MSHVRNSKGLISVPGAPEEQHAQMLHDKPKANNKDSILQKKEEEMLSAS